MMKTTPTKAKSNADADANVDTNVDANASSQTLAKGETFRQAYGVLQAHAETLRNQDEPNIDNLLTIVTESVAAFKVCQARIEAVEQALEKALGEAAGLVKEPRSAPKAAQPAASRAKPAEPPSPFDDDGQDIPF
jgi:exodeoxyribonuclease VII small subunit